MDPFVGWGIPALVALVPAVFRLVQGRLLVRHANDPAVAERIAAGSTPSTVIFSGVLVLLAVIWQTHAVWAIPLEILTYIAARWPLRRALFNETWSLGVYLWFYVRLLIVIYGFWILLMTTPWLLDLDGMRGLGVAALLLIVLLAWNEAYGWLLRKVMRAQPVETANLLERFQNIVARTTVRPPHVEYVEMAGGVFVNAIALPDTRRPAVLFTSTLLERLDDDEIAAVFAHEVAHLEYFSPAYLRKHRTIGWLMIVGAVAIAPVVHTFAPDYGLVITAWPLVTLAYLTYRGQQRQKHETDSDLRAVALTGDPEALVRGLTRLYALMKLPRRLDPNVEVRASHPSLARRLQAIRKAAGSDAVQMRDPAAFTSGAQSLTLWPDRVVWSDGDVTSVTLPYSTVDELRIDAGIGGRMRLVLSDREGRKWTLPLDAGDVSRAQAALDHIDTALTAAPANNTRWHGIARLTAFIATLAAVLTSHLAAVVVAALAALFPHRPVVVAAGVACLAGSLAALRDGMAPQLIAFGLLAGAGLLFVAWRDRTDVAPARAWQALGVIGGLAVLFALPVAIAGADLLALHQASRAWSAAATFAIAFAAATLLRSSAAWRAAAGLCLIVAASLSVMAAPSTLDAWLDDPLLTRAQPGESRLLSDTPSATFDVAIPYARLALSPSAASFAAIHQDDDRSTVIRVGGPRRALVDFQGDEALFIDDSALLISRHGPAGVTVSLIDAVAQQVLWEQPLDIFNASLSISRDGATWQAVGISERSHPLRVSGTRDGAITERFEWTAMVTGEDSSETVVWSSGERMLVHATDYTRVGRVPQVFGSFGVSLMNPWRSESRLTLFGDGEPRDIIRSVLDVNCYSGTFIGDRPVCEAYDGSRTHVVTLNPDDASVLPLTVINSRTALEFEAGWLIGWLGGRPLALDPSTRLMVRPPTAASDDRRSYFAAGPSVLALVNSDGQSSRVRVYRGAGSEVAMR